MQTQAHTERHSSAKPVRAYVPPKRIKKIVGSRWVPSSPKDPALPASHLESVVSSMDEYDDFDDFDLDGDSTAAALCDYETE